jgi:D-alanine-D-alanine ligase
LDAYDIPYTFSDPMVLSLSLHKGMTKRVIRDLGIPTPNFCVIEMKSDAMAVDLPFPVFAKPVAEGTGKGIAASSRIMNRKQLLSVCESLLERYRQPVLVETFLSGREFTVGIVGTGKDAMAIGVVEVVLKDNAEADAYSYLNKERYEELVEYRLLKDTAAKKATEVALAAWRGLGCRDAGRVDLRADAGGTPNFLEVNPLAGLHPIRSDLCIIATKIGITYDKLINMIISSALSRCSPERLAYAQSSNWNCP